MTVESILYGIGFSFPTVLILLVSASTGWIVKKEAGAIVGSAVVTAILNFGVIVREGGSLVLERQAAIAAGASIVSSAVTSAALYSVAQAMRAEAAGQPKLVVALASLALITGSTAASIAGSLLLTGYAMWNDQIGGLLVYVLVLGGLAVAVLEWEKDKSTSEHMQSTATDTVDH